MSERILTRLSEIADEQAELRDELAALSELAELDEDQEARFDELTGDESPVYDLRDERQKLEQRLKVLDTVREAADAGHKTAEDGEDRSIQFQKQTNMDVDPVRGSRTEIRDAALKALESEHKRQAVDVSDASAAHIEKMIRTKTHNLDGDVIARRMLVTESDGYKSAFAKAMHDAQPAFTPEEARAVNQFRAVEQGLTDASGGFGVPVLIDPSIILTSGAVSAPLLGVSRIENITNDAWRGVSSAGVAFTATAEAVAATATQATLAQPIITPEKTMAYIPYSFEIGGDYPNFAGEMAALIEAAYIDYLSQETATGAAGVVGIFTAVDANAANEVVVTTSGLLAPEDALIVHNALPERSRPRAAWFMDVSVESQLRVGADGYGTRDLSSEGIGPLLGKRVLLSDHAPAFTGTTGTVNLAVFGDFSKYVIAQRVGMNIELIPNVVNGSGVPTGQRAWLAWARVGADLVDDVSAFRLLKNAT